MGREKGSGAATPRVRWFAACAAAIVAASLASCEKPLGGDRTPVARVEVTPPTATLGAGGSTTLSVRVTGGDGDLLADRTVFWSSEDPAVATVSPIGVVTAVAPGTVKIAASSEGQSGLSTVTVTPRPVSLVRVTPGTAQIIAGDSTPLEAEALDAGGVPVTGREVTWTSSNTQIATVSNAGVVTGIAPGTAVITATIDGVAGTANVVVLRVPVASVSVSLGTASIPQNQSTQATATLRDASGRILTDRTVSWTAENPAIAAVDGSGRVTGLGVGSTRVRATSEGVSGTAPLTVTIIPVASLRVLPSSVSLVVGQTLALTLNLFDGNDNPLSAVGRKITWTSSDESVVTVTEDGTVAAIATGKATITASTPGASGTVSGTATVNVGQVPVGAVRVTPSSASVAVGSSLQLLDSAFDVGGNVMIGRTATWSTDDAAVATVSASGLVTGVATGTAKITASIGSVSGSSTVTVALTPIATVGVVLGATAIQERQTTQATAVLRDASGTVLSGRAVAWSSSDPTVATVDQSGRVTGVRTGATSIVATSDGRTGNAALSVIPIPVASLELTPPSLTLASGASSTLSANLYDSQGNQLSFSGRTITWTSTNTAVATVNTAGVVTAVAGGTTQIIASTPGSAGAVADTSTLTVTLTPVALVTINPPKDTVSVLGQITLQAATFDASNNPLSGRAVVWGSTNLGVATVSQSGVVTGLTPGVDTITATSEGIVGRAEVVVTLVPVGSVTMSSDTATLYPGGTRQFSVTLRDALGNVLTGRPVTWTSNAKKVSVSSSGLVTGADSGRALVIATSEGKADTAAIDVLLPVASVSVAPTTATLTVGATQQYTATPRDSLGGILTGRSVTWTTSNSAIATVTSAGLVTAVSTGGVQVRATSEGITGAGLLVIQGSNVATVTLTHSGGFVLPGGTRTITATARDVNGRPVAGRVVVWSSSNTRLGTITPDANPSMTDNNGEATATFKAVGLFGPVTITARVTGVTGTVSVFVF